jgi:3-oxoadipate enol-lactonase
VRGSYVEQAGEGPAVVLLHAGGCDSRMWDPQWKAFSAAHRAVRYDMRGCGRTPIEEFPVCFGRDAIGLLEQLRIARAALVGVSLGGRVALEVAVARPDLVTALVLVGAGLPDHEWSEDVTSFRAEEDAAVERGDLEAAVEAGLRTWVDGPRRGPEGVDSAVRAAVADMTRRSLELQLPVWDQFKEDRLVPDLDARLGEVEAPTLVIAGEEDVADIHAIAERFLREIAGARFAAIAGAAHFPNMERPAEFNELVLAFLAEAGR